MYKRLVDESAVLSRYALNLSLDAPLWSGLEREVGFCHSRVAL